MNIKSEQKTTKTYKTNRVVLNLTKDQAVYLMEFIGETNPLILHSGTPIRKIYERLKKTITKRNIQNGN
jgi:hypothetical protein